jgi:hypothetical protein
MRSDLGRPEQSGGSSVPWSGRRPAPSGELDCVRRSRTVVGAVLAEQHDEWTEARRYLGPDALARARAAVTPNSPEEAASELVPALSA